MSTPRSWSRGSGRQVDMSGRQADEVGWSQKVTEMGRGTDKDGKGKKGGHTMTRSLVPKVIIWLRVVSSLSVGNYIHAFGSHVSNFHMTSQKGSKMSQMCDM